MFLPMSFSLTYPSPLSVQSITCNHEQKVRRLEAGKVLYIEIETVINLTNS